MKKIRTQDAVGQVLCHDMTQIIKGVTKDARFRKGHIVTEEDIPVLLELLADETDHIAHVAQLISRQSGEPVDYAALVSGVD